MPTPIKRAAYAWLDELGGTEFICERVASGEPLSQIAKSIGLSRPMLSKWCNEPERKDRYTNARRESAGALVDQGTEILDNSNWREVQLAKARAEWRKWQAGIHDETYRDKQDIGTQVNVENLHIGALQQAPRQAAHIIEHDAQQLPDWTE